MARPEVQPQDCPTPEYHETHRYCPSCIWTEDYGKPAPSVETVLVGIGDQVQAMMEKAPVPMAAFILFSQAGPVEYRSPYPKALFIEHLRKAADELEQG